MTEKYILDQHGEPIAEPDLFKWAAWVESADPLQVVKQEYIGDVQISTVFMFLNLRFAPGDPILWETMVFKIAGKERYAMDQFRCGGSREQAEAMHERVKQKILCRQSSNGVVEEP